MPGGGMALIRAREALDSLKVTGDELTGVNVLRRSLERPLMLIAENTGVSGDVILSESLKGTGDWGYDAEKGEFCNLLERGIIDPAKVTRAAVENACSIAGMILTTESLITDIIEKPKAGEPPTPDYYG